VTIRTSDVHVDLDGHFIVGAVVIVRGDVVRRNQGSGIFADCPANPIGNAVTTNDFQEVVLSGTGCLSFQNMAQ